MKKNLNKQINILKNKIINNYTLFSKLHKLEFIKNILLFNLF